MRKRLAQKIKLKMPCARSKNLTRQKWMLKKPGESASSSGMSSTGRSMQLVNTVVKFRGQRRVMDGVLIWHQTTLIWITAKTLMTPRTKSFWNICQPKVQFQKCWIKIKRQSHWALLKRVVSLILAIWTLTQTILQNQEVAKSSPPQQT